MKKLWLVGLLIAALVVPNMLLAAEGATKGSVQVGGKIKWLYSYQKLSKDALGASAAGQIYGFDGAGQENFQTSNVELDINGTVGEKVAYVIELQAGNPVNVLGMKSNPNEMGTIGVRQAKIMISDVVPMTTVTLGTFMLPISTYQQRATNDLDLILLPAMNGVYGVGGYAGFATIEGAPAGTLNNPIGLNWQATGVNFAIKPMDMLEVDLVYFNGSAGGAPNADVDLEKSMLINLQVKPSNAVIAIGYLSEGWQEDTSGAGGRTEEQKASGYVITADYVTDKIDLTFDWTQMTTHDYQVDQKGKVCNWVWTGYQITAGYWITDSIEALIRYDFLDPDTLNQKTVGVTAYDQLVVWTLGMNYKIADNAELAVNYVMPKEQGSEIDMRAAIPEVGGKYQVLANDLLLIQIQVWQ